MALGLRNLDRVPAPLLVLAAAVSVQSGAAVAVDLFPRVGPLGAVWLRLALSAVVMVAVARPRWAGIRPAPLGWAVVFGLVLAAMNTAFYLSISRISLGPAVTVEFIGPLAVAVAGSRRFLDLVWVGLAGAGVALLAGAGAEAGRSTHLDAVGLGLAAVAGVCWSAYILLAQRVGRMFPGASGLSIALVVGALVLAPAALARHASDMGSAGVLAAGFGVALLSSAVPYSLELAALRRMRASTFGVVLSLDPAVAALSGLVVLGQHLSWGEWVAIGCVVTASGGASLRGGQPPAEPAPLPLADAELAAADPARS